MKQVLKIGISCVFALALFLASGCADRVTLNISGQVEQWRETAGTPALAVAVVNSQGTLRNGVAGLSSVDDAAKVTASDLWFLGSSSKTMTASLAGVLVQQGKIRWDTTVGEVFSDLPDVLPAYKGVSLEELLSHRSGLPAYDTSEALATVPTSFPGDLRQQRASLTDWALQQIPDNVPGTTVEYSNLGYFVAAVMLERASNQTWEQSLQSNLLTPLGLTPKFDLPGVGDPNQPWGHVWDDSQWVSVDPNDPENQIPEIANPVGNVSMSLSDFAKWAQINLAGLRGVDNLVLKASTIQKLHSVVGGSTDGTGQATAWYENELDGHVISGTLGSDGTFYSLILIDAQSDRAVAIFTNGTKDNLGLDTDPVLTEIMAIAEQQLKF